MPQRTPRLLLIKGRSWTGIRVGDKEPKERQTPRRWAPRNDGYKEHFCDSCSCRVSLATLEIEKEAGEFHVGWFGDFDIAFCAVDDVNVVAEALDEAGFVGGVDAVSCGFGECFFQQFDEKNLPSLCEDDALAGNSAGDQRHILRQTAALYFLYGVHCGDAENGCSAFAGFF